MFLIILQIRKGLIPGQGIKRVICMSIPMSSINNLDSVIIYSFTPQNKDMTPNVSIITSTNYIIKKTKKSNKNKAYIPKIIKIK